MDARAVALRADLRHSGLLPPEARSNSRESFHCGSTSANTTNTAEMSFMSFRFSPACSASWMTTR